MRIGELSKRTGVSIRMLRYYEAEGLLDPARTAAGYRDFSPLDEETVHQIIVLGAAGMTLSDIRQFLPCSLSARGEFEPCDELREQLADQIKRVDGKIARLAESRMALKTILSEARAIRRVAARFFACHFGWTVEVTSGHGASSGETYPALICLPAATLGLTVNRHAPHRSSCRAQ